MEGWIIENMCDLDIASNGSTMVLHTIAVYCSRVQLLLILFEKLPLILSGLDARSGLRTHYLEKSTLVFIREIPLKIFEISSKKKTCEFFKKKKNDFFGQEISQLFFSMKF